MIMRVNLVREHRLKMGTKVPLMNYRLLPSRLKLEGLARVKELQILVLVELIKKSRRS